MDAENKLEFATSWRRYIPIAVGAIGVLLIVGGLVWEYINSNQKTSQEVGSNFQESDQNGGSEKIGSVAGVQSVKPVRMIKVDIDGSVIKPGVVEIPYDSRIQDVLIAAGGLTPKADRIYISKYINLAQRVVDGSKIYIPAVGENTQGISTNSLQISTNTASGLVNINSASESELDALPGVGPVTAGKIIANRPYQETSELVSKKAVSQSVFLKIKDSVTTY